LANRKNPCALHCWIPPKLAGLTLSYGDALTDSRFSYSGTELDAVAEATNYYDWIVDSFAGHIGDRCIEAGAGIGTVSELLLKRVSPRILTLIEPAENNVPVLRYRFAGDSRVKIYHGYLEDLTGSVESNSIIAVNVLEHVEKDDEFLEASYEILTPGGALLLLVPALPAIFGSLDRAFDHFRRYTKSGLRTSLVAAGFEVETIHYLNLVGVAAWFFSGRVLRRTTLGRGQVRFYDRWIIPFVRRLESVIPVPVGQSILAIARKPADATSTRARS
jgi:SAM-dependent methyltransferase